MVVHKLKTDLLLVFWLALLVLSCSCLLLKIDDLRWVNQITGLYRAVYEKLTYSIFIGVPNLLLVIRLRHKHIQVVLRKLVLRFEISFENFLANLSVAPALLVSHLFDNSTLQIIPGFVEHRLNILRLELDNHKLMVISQEQKARNLKALRLLSIVEEL